MTNLYKIFIPEKFTEQIHEMKSTTKGALAGTGLGLAAGTVYNATKGRFSRTKTGAGMVFGGAAAGIALQIRRIKKACEKAFPNDQEDCFRFRNRFGRLPKNKEELEKGPRK